MLLPAAVPIVVVVEVVDALGDDSTVTLYKALSKSSGGGVSFVVALLERCFVYGTHEGFFHDGSDLEEDEAAL